MSELAFTSGLSAAPDLSLFVLAASLAVGLIVLIFLLIALGVFTLPLFFAVIFGLEAFLRVAQNSGFFLVKMALLTLRSLRRNLLRTALTYVALFVFTGVLTLIYSVVAFLDNVTREKETDVKVILTEKYQIPSQMKPAYINQLKAILENDLPAESRPKNGAADFMSWSFILGSLDPVNRTMENMLFCFALDPAVIPTMMDGLQKTDLSDEDFAQVQAAVKLMQQDKRNIVVGQDRLNTVGKKVGDEIKMYSVAYADLEFEMKIVATLPPGRFDQNTFMQYDYLAAKLDEYKAKKGKEHPQADRCVNLIWVRLPDKKAYEELATIVTDPAKFSSPAVKLETASAGIGAFLDAFKDIFWAIKFIVMPALAVIMALVVSITLTISVRERRTEMAVLKVLGFQPNQVLLMIIGEGLLIGFLSGAICTWTAYAVYIVKFPGGIKFPIAFFGAFQLPLIVVLLGPALGLVVALVGSFLPAWNARSVKASEVFSQVA